MFSNKTTFPPLRLGALTALAYLLLTAVVPSNSTRIHTWPWAFYTDILCLIPIVLLGARLAFRTSETFVGRGALLFTGCVVGLGVCHATHPVFSFGVALLLFAGLCWTALVAERVASWESADKPDDLAPFHAARWTGLLLLLPLLSASVLWIQDLRAGAKVEGWRYIFSHFEFYRNPHPFGHWNYIGGYALLCLPWMIALALAERGTMRKAWAAAAAISFFVLVSAFSRGAVLGTGVALLAAIIFRVHSHRFSRGKTALVLAAGVAAVALLILANPRFRDFVLHPGTLLRPNEGDVQRLGMMEGGWLLFRKSMWLGHGPGMTPFVFPTVRASLIGGVETSFELHNSAVEIAATLGAAGLIAAMMLIACVAKAVSQWLNEPEGEARLTSFRQASLYSLIGYGVIALTDYQLNVPAIVAVCGLHLGTVLGVRSSKAVRTYARSAILGKTLGWILLFAPLPAVAILLPEWKARHLFWEAWWVTPEKNRELLLSRLHEAAEASPTNPFYRTMSGLQLAREAQKLGAARDAETLRQLARTELTRSLAVDLHQEPVEAALGWLAMDDSANSAEKHFREALGYIPDRDTLHLGLALSQLAQGNQAGAVHSLALECLVNPEFFTSPFWSAPPLQPLHTRVLEEFEHLVERATHDVNLPTWRRPPLAYLEGWVRWWTTGALPTAAQLSGATPEQREFFAIISEPRETSVSDRQFAALLSAYRNPSHAEAKLKACVEPLSSEAIAGAIARLRAAPPDFGAFLRTSAPNHEGVAWEDISRLHYNIMARNLDGPGLPDLAPRPVDRFIHEFLNFTFPLKGMIPGRVLQNLEHP